MFIYFGDCEYPWQNIVHGCYRVSTNELAWWDAEEQCETYGGHLVKIDDEEEQQALQGWLGM